jgi:OTU domain-containing protein 6
VAEQCTEEDVDYTTIRGACADALLRHEEEYAPFAESHDHGSYVNYVERVRSSTDWGGHLELRALAGALRRPVVVYSADAAPLRLGEDENGEDILLSYHRHYYALGEHYNSVVKK